MRAHYPCHPRQQYVLKYTLKYTPFDLRIYLLGQLVVCITAARLSPRYRARGSLQSSLDLKGLAEHASRLQARGNDLDWALQPTKNRAFQQHCIDNRDARYLDSSGLGHAPVCGEESRVRKPGMKLVPDLVLGGNQGDRVDMVGETNGAPRGLKHGRLDRSSLSYCELLGFKRYRRSLLPRLLVNWSSCSQPRSFLF